MEKVQVPTRDSIKISMVVLCNYQRKCLHTHRSRDSASHFRQFCAGLGGFKTALRQFQDISSLVLRQTRDGVSCAGERVCKQSRRKACLDRKKVIYATNA